MNNCSKCQLYSLKKAGVAPPAFFVAYLTAAIRVAIAVIKAATATKTFTMYSNCSFVALANYIHLPSYRDKLIITYLVLLFVEFIVVVEGFF